MTKSPYQKSINNTELDATERLSRLPDFVKKTLTSLQKAGFEAFIVGGCVRDLLMGQEPKDWDITTNARPDDILATLPGSKYENNFGTVLWPIHLSDSTAVLEITTYRSEAGYDDHRHPSEITFEDKLENDLSRRDFTINAMAMDQTGQIIDYYGGQKDLNLKVIRTVGEPADRFKEDALRLLRVVRFSCRFGFAIEPKTERAMVKLAGSIKFVANERIRDELVKIIASPRAYDGIKKLHDTKLLQYILPELEEGYGVEQNHHHIYTVFDHNLLSLKHCPSDDYLVRLAALFHDIGKTKAKKIVNGQATFYNHEYISAKLTQKIMTRLHFSNQEIDRVVNLVRNHMFYYNVGEVTEASVRRLIAKTGEQNLADLIDLRIADRLGSGTAKAKPYKLRHLEYMFDKVRHDPVSVKMLKINGTDLMTKFKLKPGPQIGTILDIILADVIDNPQLNDKDALLKLAQPLINLDLAELRQRAKSIIAKERLAEDQQIRQQHQV
ncbi:HD domain-containing protein [Candidatus Falkowbacteria bacterium]|nr:HD domain-containing protein [Candidatus Falkowbacteria bacterium]